MTDNFRSQQTSCGAEPERRAPLPILRWVGIGVLAAIPIIAAVLAALYLLPDRTEEGTLVKTPVVTSAAVSETASTEREAVSVSFVGVGAGDAAQQLTLGEPVQLQVRLEPADASGTVTWTSSDRSVASVDDSGTVTPLYPGTVTITAACGAASQGCTFSVEPRASYTLDQVHDVERNYFVSWIDARRSHADACTNLEQQGHGDVCTGYFENGTLLYVDSYYVEMIDLDNDEWNYRVDRVYFDAETDTVYYIRQTDENTGFVQELYYYDGLLFRTVGNGKIYDGNYDGYDYWATDYYREMYELCKHVQSDY